MFSGKIEALKFAAANADLFVVDFCRSYLFFRDASSCARISFRIRFYLDLGSSPQN